MMDNNSLASSSVSSTTSSSTTTMTYDRSIKLLIIGDSGVGKTCLLMRYCNESFNPTYLTTIGIDFKVKVVSMDDSTTTKLQIWDTAGQERFRTLTKSYYRGMEGIVLVYDVTDRRSFDSIRHWISTIEEHTTTTGKKNTKKQQKKKKNNTDVAVNKILIGNKCDMMMLSSSNNNNNFVTTEEGQKLADEFDMKFYECSAKDNINVDECFMSITKDIIQRLPDNNNNNWNNKNNNNIILKKKNNKNNTKSRCAC